MSEDGALHRTHAALITAFGKYKAKNTRILYDAIGTLAEAVSSFLWY